MRTVMQERWVSVHIYLKGNIDVFLIRVLPKLLGQLAGNFSQYFYVRYFDPKPHLRLRLNTNKYTEITELLIGKLEEFIAEKEDTRFEIEHYDFVHYMAEIERYGGDKMISLAEESFQLSSNVVLSIMQEHDWNYDHAIGFGIKLHILFFTSANLDPQVKKSILERTYFGWMANFINHNPSLTPELVQEAFSKSYNRQEKKLGLIKKKLMRSLESRFKKENDPLFEWVTGTKKIHEKYTLAVMAEKNIDPGFPPITSDDERIGRIYESTLHMTNNRLGIMNIDESFLAYLLLKLLY